MSEAINWQSNLCIKDQRHPDYKDNTAWVHVDGVAPEPRNNCACDNCFYGRDALAVAHLESGRITKEDVDELFDAQVGVTQSSDSMDEGAKYHFLTGLEWARSAILSLLSQPERTPHSIVEELRKAIDVKMKCACQHCGRMTSVDNLHHITDPVRRVIDRLSQPEQEWVRVEDCNLPDEALVWAHSTLPHRAYKKLVGQLLIKYARNPANGVTHVYPVELPPRFTPSEGEDEKHQPK